jgi:hypothetical protein
MAFATMVKRKFVSLGFASQRNGTPVIIARKPEKDNAETHRRSGGFVPSGVGRVINLDHPLAKLSGEFDWELIRSEIEPSFCDTNGHPVADTRVLVRLFSLKSDFNLSDEQLLPR